MPAEITARSFQEPVREPGHRLVLPMPGPPILTDRRGCVVLSIVSHRTGVPVPLLVHPKRCQAPVAAARQLAMYLTHVILGRSLTEVGRLFWRDRTTVAHACALIEDRRDDPAFETKVNNLEQIIISRAVAVSARE